MTGHRQTLRDIARHLPERTVADVEEVVDLLIDRWREELLAGGTVRIPDIGTLTIEVQTVHAGGSVLDYLPDDTPPVLCRIYGRFRPSKQLKLQIKEEAAT